MAGQFRRSQAFEADLDTKKGQAGCFPILALSALSRRLLRQATEQRLVPARRRRPLPEVYDFVVDLDANNGVVALESDEAVGDVLDNPGLLGAELLDDFPLGLLRDLRGLNIGLRFGDRVVSHI